MVGRVSQRTAQWKCIAETKRATWWDRSQRPVGLVSVRRSYKFRLRPTAKQHVSLEKCLYLHCELYNAALAERRQAYETTVKKSPLYYSQERPKASVSYNTQSAQLRDIRKLRPDIAIWSFSSQQATLRRLNKAFEGFFRRLGAGESPGYPRFKAAHRFDSVEWPSDGDGCKFKPEVSRVYLQGIGHVKVTAHRKVQGRIKTVSVKREGRRWYLILSCDGVPAKPLPKTDKQVGIDVGVVSFLTSSDGVHIENPRWARTGAECLERAQRVLSKKEKGSSNRRAARETVAQRHRKIANQRKDFHHKIACKLVRDYDVIAVEDLRVKNMVKRAKPVANPEQAGDFLPNGQAAKSGLNRSISDAGWAQFRSILCAKAEEAGRVMVSVNPRYTSCRCDCGHIASKNRVNQALFRCQRCGYSANADEHAAKTILRAGLALLAAQAA